MTRVLILGLCLLAPGAAVRAQSVSSRTTLPPGPYRIGLVTHVAPLTIDLTAADGIAEVEHDRVERDEDRAHARRPAEPEHHAEQWGPGQARLRSPVESTIGAATGQHAEKHQPHPDHDHPQHPGDHVLPANQQTAH